MNPGVRQSDPADKLSHPVRISPGFSDTLDFLVVTAVRHLLIGIYRAKAADPLCFTIFRYQNFVRIGIVGMGAMGILRASSGVITI
jgi:hypothetical protein